jgi:hypothetical protein
VTDESPELVEAWIARTKPKYPIAIAGGAFENQIGVPHFPYSAVIGPDGNIVYAGNSGGGEGRIGDAMGRSKKSGLWPKSLSKITKVMMGDPVKAYDELKKLQAGGKVGETDKQFVDDFVAFLEGTAKSALDEAKGLKEKGFVLKAVKAVEAFSKAPTAFPTTADSTALLKELEALPDYKKELVGGEAFAEAEALDKDMQYLEAFDAYKSISKKFAGTRIAENGRAQAERILKEGLAGFEDACETCSRSKRACDKHKKEVKL